jgi:ADP-ribose pyrophosphatase YjhB (NUDIX family)
VHQELIEREQAFNVGVKAVIVQNGRLLLLKRRGRPFWDVPGGRINHGEDVRQALERELREELPGVSRIRIGRLLYVEQTEFGLPRGRLPNGNCLLLVLFRVSVKLAHPIMPGDEHTSARWVLPATFDSFDIPPPILEAAKKALHCGS